MSLTIKIQIDMRTESHEAELSFPLATIDATGTAEHNMAMISQFTNQLMTSAFDTPDLSPALTPEASSDAGSTRIDVDEANESLSTGIKIVRLAFWRVDEHLANLAIHRHHLVELVKHHLIERLETSSDNIFFTFNEAILESHKTLQECGLEDGDRIQVHFFHPERVGQE